MLTLDDIRNQIPRYLTAEQQRELVHQLNDFEGKNYYTGLYPDNLLQGDRCSGIEILNFENGVRDRVRGMVLSNSCDINVDNPRDFRQGW